MPLLLFDVSVAFMLLHLHDTLFIKSHVEIYKLQIVVVDINQLINESDDKIGVNLRDDI